MPVDMWELLEQAGVPRLPEVELARFLAEIGTMRASLPTMDQFQGVEPFGVGSQLAQDGYTAKFPVVIVPGIISTVSIVMEHDAPIAETSREGPRELVNTT